MKKLIIIIALATLSVFTLASCTKESSKPAENTKLTFWTGAETVDFYKETVKDFLKENPNFGYTVSVVPKDTGSAAQNFLDDPTIGADIFTIAHDNIGKLISGNVPAIQPLGQDLIDQINNDNPQSFIDVVQNKLNNDNVYYAVPVMSQALVLYYNTEFLTKEDVQNWETIKAKAAALNDDVQATSLNGTDGFNNSFLLLATNAADHSTSVQLYKDGKANNNFVSGDDTISILRWGQHFFDQNEAGSAKWPTTSGFSVELKDKHSLSFIGGAWNYAAAEAALGKNLGIAMLPKFTITEDDAYGTCKAGTVFQSGTFADCKCLVMKLTNDSARAQSIQKLMKYLSSKDIQEKCFEATGSVPAYKNAEKEFKSMQGDSLQAQLAKVQIEMAQWGISQPFGFDAHFNTWYYSKGTPDLYVQILNNLDNKYSTPEQIKAQLISIEQTYKTGESPAN